MTHVETSTGVQAPVADLRRVARARDCLIMVDGVRAAAGIEEDMQAMAIDVLVTGRRRAQSSWRGWRNIGWAPAWTHARS